MRYQRGQTQRWRWTLSHGLLGAWRVQTLDSSYLAVCSSFPLTTNNHINIGVGDGGANLLEKCFLFSGKYRVKSGHFVDFNTYIVGWKCLLFKLPELLRISASESLCSSAIHAITTLSISTNCRPNIQTAWQESPGRPCRVCWGCGQLYRRCPGPNPRGDANVI